MQRVIELLDKKVETLFNRQDFEDSYNGQIDELTVQVEDLREKLENIREVCRE